MKYILGIVIGIMVYHYWPEQVQSIASDTQSVIHKGAEAVADSTRPDALTRLKDAVK